MQFAHLLFRDWLWYMDEKFTDNTLYKDILLDRLGINEGMLMENIVAQSFRYSGRKLYFYSRADARTRANDIEIDFLIRKSGKISPIEVKSAAYRKHSSIDKFNAKFHRRLGEKFIFYGKDVMIKEKVIHLPLYMASLV